MYTLPFIRTTNSFHQFFSQYMCMLSWVLELTLYLYIFRPDLESDSEAEDVEHAEKLRQVKVVLEEVINSLGTILSIINNLLYFVL